MQDRAEIPAAWCCAASSRPLEVRNICCERQHAVARAIWTGFRTEIFENLKRPQHADARHSVWGPLRVVVRLQHAGRSGFRRELARRVKDRATE